MIRAEAVSVRAGHRILLDDVSVAVPPGTVTAVLGPNGAGKTTLLRVLCGLLRPGSGRVTWDGQGLDGIRPAVLARRRAVLGQHQALEFGLSVQEVVSLGRLPHAGTPDARRDAAAVTEAMAAFGLGPFRHRSYPSLSGGERQRVQLARIAAQLWRSSPEGPGQALFLDEPTAALDLAQQSAALGFARQAARGGAAVLAVLHDLNQAATADAVILLRNGRVQAAGPATAVLQPGTLQDCFGVAVEAVRREDGNTGFLLR